MYLKETLDQFTSINNILKLLKKSPGFNKYCIQERLPKETVITSDKRRKYIYIIEDGFMKLVFEGTNKHNFSYILQKGAFPHLPVYTEDIPKHMMLIALTGVVWWKIEFQFFKEMMELEDPRNYIMLHQLAETRRRLYIIAVQEKLSSRESIYFSLNTMIDYGLRVSEKAVELPKFLTYQILADNSNTSKSYTSKVLSNLREKGILESQKKPWRINDVQKLQELIDAEALLAIL
ncbi:Crp/Fnr family transcriptional regulator [Listeria innocua]|uniref:Crp/Fnr family transcriptional regulator n=1 Tax=Listeria innocua TaxID=1642 RepID=UPI0016261A64|nr:Crp/Fnr family transcriptional regulator [Listeria innocua]MBC2156710.1 Crp/Fnr family transcriptional regulator [Listeria innocua]